MPRSHRPSAALVVASLALVLSTGTMSVSAADLIGSGDIQNNSIRGADVHDGSLQSADFADGSVRFIDMGIGSVGTRTIRDGTINTTLLGDGAVTGRKMADGTVRSVDIADGTLLPFDFAPGTLPGPLPRTEVVATTTGVSEDAARAAAPEVVLYEMGSLTVYGKCYTVTTVNDTVGEVFIKTSQDGAVMDSHVDSLIGGVQHNFFLNTDTLEVDRQLAYRDSGTDSANLDAADDGDFTALAPDGTTLRGWSIVAAKNGTLPDGNGVYGPGNICLFGGAVLGS